MLRMTEFSRAYGVTRNTIRRWCAEFAPFLSDGANPEAGETRSFEMEDGGVIAIIATMRANNATYESIHAALMDGERGVWPPPSMADDDGDDGGDDTQQETAVMVRLSAALAHTEGKLTAVSAERDRLLASLAEERAARLDAEKVAATVDLLQSELDRARLPFWKRWGS